MRLLQLMAVTMHYVAHGTLLFMSVILYMRVNSLHLRVDTMNVAFAALVELYRRERHELNDVPVGVVVDGTCVTDAIANQPQE